MAEDRTPRKWRGNLPERPNPRTRSFFETQESKRVRELENEVALKFYKEQLEAQYREVAGENLAQEVHQTLDRAKDLADHAERNTESELTARMNAKILEGWTEGQANNFRNRSGN